ncbi:hypothetical protein F4861DRAFT_531450 [Xylaria intraflava]|nr:hypothetical protein F4861DRAFT_531450 [Xylaria intraflava]
MELTPIKVRGKKRARGDQIPVDPRPEPLNKRLGQKRQARLRRPKASIIEKFMPLEILERIFWLSENVNFPRASPRLGRMLSGSSTLRETFISAFGPTWAVWLGRVDNRVSPLATLNFAEGEDTALFGGNPAFQTDLLACSWATIDLILDCRDTWVRRHVRCLPSEHNPLWGNPVGAGSDYAGAGVTTEVSDVKEVRSHFNRDYAAFRNIEQLSISGTKTWIEVHRSIEIPDGLITGPWSEKDLQKYFWLVRSGARLSPSQTWEVTREGFRNAISSQNAPNLTVMRLLHILGAFREWPPHVKDEESRSVSAIMLSARDNDQVLHAKYMYVGALLTNRMTGPFNDVH